MLLISNVNTQNNYWNMFPSEEAINDISRFVDSVPINRNIKDISRTNPDPYWYELAYRGIKGKRDSPIPVNFIPDPNSEAIPIPAGAPTITFGVVITDASGYDSIAFNTVHHEALRMFEWQANKQGSIVLNGTTYYVDLKVLSGGPDCGDFIIEYEYLINVVGVDFLFQPVNPNCTQLAFLAEAYHVPLINTVDFALTIYQGIPGLPFMNLTQTYSLTANYSLVIPSCLIPLMKKGAKSVSIIYTESTGGSIIPAMESAIITYNLTKVMATLNLDLDKQKAAAASGDGCSYIRPIIQQLKVSRPDILYYSLGPIYTEQGIRCMQKELYYPPAFWLFASSTIQGTSESWMTSFSLINDLWLGQDNTTDSLFGSATQYGNDFSRLWGVSNINLISYAATSSTGGNIIIKAINSIGTTDPDLFRQAMYNIRFASIIGDMYIPVGQNVFSHSFFCHQQGNGAGANDSFIIFPDTANTVGVEYPADSLISRPASFLDSLKHKSWWTKPRIAGVSVGVVIIVLLILGIIVGLIYLENTYHFIFIPKSGTGTKDLDEWGS